MGWFFRQSGAESTSLESRLTREFASLLSAMGMGHGQAIERAEVVVRRAQMK
jgi:hypothetical protein